MNNVELVEVLNATDNLLEYFAGFSLWDSRLERVTF